MTTTVDDSNITYMITSKSLTVARIFSSSPSFSSMILFSIPSSEGILDKSLLGRYKITSLREPFVCALIRYGKRFEPTVPLWPKRATIGAMRMIALRLSVVKDESCRSIKAAKYYRSHLYVAKGGARVWRLSTSCVRARHDKRGFCNERVRSRQQSQFSPKYSGSWEEDAIITIQRLAQSQQIAAWKCMVVLTLERKGTYQQKLIHVLKLLEFSETREKLPNRSL